MFPVIRMTVNPVLETQSVTADGAAPARWLMMLHGIYGAGRNWSSVARLLVRAHPEWGALLVDLRQHGGSRGFAPPHTLAATAADLGAAQASGPVTAILGHSFGGKVALLHAHGSHDIEQAWVVDSTPAAREPGGSAWNMLEILRALPGEFEDRDAAVTALMERDVERGIALWMTTNLEHSEGRYRWRIDFDDMEALLRDYYRAGLWDLVEAPRAGLTLHFVRATRGSIIDDDDVARLERAAETTGRVFLHEVEGGHWLNADNPEGLVALLAQEL